MSLSILIRLVPETGSEMSSAELRGQAEVVETGETVLFKDQGEMLEFLQRVRARPWSTDAAAGSVDDLMPTGVLQPDVLRT